MSSTSARIKEKVYDIVKDYKVHSIDEIKEECIKGGIIDEEKTKLVRVVIFNMKKENENLVSVGRGKYKLLKENGMKNIEFADAVECIQNKLIEWQGLNWLKCSDAELKAVRAEYKELTDLVKYIDNFSSEL